MNKTLLTLIVAATAMVNFAPTAHAQEVKDLRVVCKATGSHGLCHTRTAPPEDKFGPLRGLTMPLETVQELLEKMKNARRLHQEHQKQLQQMQKDNDKIREREISNEIQKAIDKLLRELYPQQTDPSQNKRHRRETPYERYQRQSNELFRNFRGPGALVPHYPTPRGSGAMFPQVTLHRSNGY